jgi:hypothetical protein
MVGRDLHACGDLFRRGWLQETEDLLCRGEGSSFAGTQKSGFGENMLFADSRSELCEYVCFQGQTAFTSR